MQHNKQQIIKPPENRAPLARASRKTEKSELQTHQMLKLPDTKWRKEKYI